MRRLVPVVVGVLVVVAGLIGLMALASGRDDAGLAEHTAEGPGTYEETSSGPPPTSGEHEQRNVDRRGRRRRRRPADRARAGQRRDRLPAGGAAAALR